MEAEELQVEEAGLGPAAPAAVPVVDAALPPHAGAIIANLDQPGNRRVHFDMPLANPLPAPPPQPMPAANIQRARRHFDLVPGNIPFGPHQLVEPAIPEEQDRMQGGTPATYKYLPTGSTAAGKDAELRTGWTSPRLSKSSRPQWRIILLTITFTSSSDVSSRSG